METKQTDLEITFTPNAEDLWAKFEQTGSIETYLQFVQKTNHRQETVVPRQPSFN